MKWKSANLQTRLYSITAMILLIGLGSSILLYMTAKDDSYRGLGYEDSKIYIHDLELYGGKANVLANEFIHWFFGLWHGKSLALTIACITIFISFGLFIVANLLRPELTSDARDENNRSGTD
jgi:hypothetical protein